MELHRLDEEIGVIYRLQGVQGVCLQRGDALLANHLPFSDKRIGELVTSIHELTGGYTSVGRDVDLVCVGFEAFWLIIVCRRMLRIGVLVKPDSDTGMIASSCRQFLADLEEAGLSSLGEEPTLATARLASEAHAPGTNGSSPGIGSEELQSLVLSLIARVVGQAAAQKLMARELEAAQLPVTGKVALADADAFGERVFDSIPNRSKRATLLAEFRHILNQ
jgi:hypothetical protein